MRGIKLGEMKKNIDKGFPAFEKILDNVAEDLPNKGDRFINAVIRGIDNFLSPD